MTVRFDDSLPILASVVEAELGAEILLSGVVVRDVNGRLAFFASVHLDEKTINRASRRLCADLGSYARTDRVIAGSTDFGVSEVLHDSTAFRVLLNNKAVRVVDRRIVGADWLRSPRSAAVAPPRFVFASLKGGVGRSTALSVAAAHIASRGRRVLAIDLDMEAPGLGAMLLGNDTLPRFGLIDALVENGLSKLDNKFFADLVAPSSLAGRQGRIDVVPAFGQRSLNNPADILAKIARAYTEDIREDGTVATILDQVSELVDNLIEAQQYDAVLLDSRAGLHETTAAAILGLGADIFLFGLDEPQTYQGYAALFAHLARLIEGKEQGLELLERLTMVQGRASPEAASRANFVEQCRTLFLKTGLAQRSPEMPSSVPLPALPFNNVPWNDDVDDLDQVLHDEIPIGGTLAILEDERFRLFQPASQRDLLSEQIYNSSYGAFLERVDKTILLGPQV